MRQSTLWLLAGCLVSACDGGGGSIPLSELRHRVASNGCAAQVRCNATPSQQVCEATYPTGLEQLTADVAANKVHYDGTAAADCLAAIGSMGCSLSEQLSFAYPDACDRAFQGTVATGGPCFTGEECVSHTCDRSACDQTTTCCAGMCAAGDAIVALGGDCSASGARCANGAFCQLGVGTSVCTAKAAPGQPCSSFDECAGGYWCYGSTPTAQKLCTRLPTRGQACDGAMLPCDSFADNCDVASGTCVARALPGAACQVDEDCVTYAVCDTTTMKCVTQGSIGAACASDGECLFGLECPNGTCAARAPEPVCP